MTGCSIDLAWKSCQYTCLLFLIMVRIITVHKYTVLQCCNMSCRDFSRNFTQTAREVYNSPENEDKECKN